MPYDEHVVAWIVHSLHRKDKRQTVVGFVDQRLVEQKRVNRARFDWRLRAA